MTWEERMLAAAGEDGDAESTIQWAIEAVRSHLGMEVAYVSEFVGNESVYRYVDAPGLEDMLKPGDTRSLDEVYCPHILAGRLPELIPDTTREELAMSMPITQEVPVGAHVSVPLHLANGEACGMFCCLSSKADHSLNERDLRAFKLFAEIAAREVRREVAAEQETRECRQRIQQVLADEAYHAVYQPIRDFVHDRTVGFEALSRFTQGEARPPDQWFAHAFATGMGPKLELAAIRTVLAGARDLPPEIYLSVNVSPMTILDDAFDRLVMEAASARQLVLEITEHEAVQDYAELETALRPVRERGAARDRRCRGGFLESSAYRSAAAGDHQTGHVPDPCGRSRGRTPLAGVGPGVLCCRDRVHHRRRGPGNRSRARHAARPGHIDRAGVSLRQADGCRLDEQAVRVKTPYLDLAARPAALRRILRG